MVNVLKEYTDFGAFKVDTYLASLHCKPVEESFDGVSNVKVDDDSYRFTVIDAAVNTILHDSEKLNHEGVDCFKSLLNSYNAGEAANLWLKQNRTEAEYNHLNPLLAFSSVDINLSNDSLTIYRASDCEVFVETQYGWDKIHGDCMTYHGRLLASKLMQEHEETYGKYQATEKWWKVQTVQLNDLSLFSYPTLGLVDVFDNEVKVRELSEIKRIVLTSDGARLNKAILKNVNLEEYMFNGVHGNDCQHGDLSVIDIAFHV